MVGMEEADIAGGSSRMCVYEEERRRERERKSGGKREVERRASRSEREGRIDRADEDGARRNTQREAELGNRARASESAPYTPSRLVTNARDRDRAASRLSTRLHPLRTSRPFVPGFRPDRAASAPRRSAQPPRDVARRIPSSIGSPVDPRSLAPRAREGPRTASVVAFLVTVVARSARATISAIVTELVG